MIRRFMARAAALILLAASSVAHAAPRTYALDPDHTYPSFEADHMGMSLWRGKFNRSRGTVVLDREAGRGAVEVEIDLDSIDYGQDELNAWARGKEFFDTARYPNAVYRGQLKDFRNGRPTRAVGELTLHGVTRPLTLEIRDFDCRVHPVFKRDWCGADIAGSFDREAFGLTAGKDWGFDMDVALRIQAEALLDDGKTRSARPAP